MKIFICVVGMAIESTIEFDRILCKCDDDGVEMLFDGNSTTAKVKSQNHALQRNCAFSICVA